MHGLASAAPAGPSAHACHGDSARCVRSVRSRGTLGDSAAISPRNTMKYQPYLVCSSPWFVHSEATKHIEYSDIYIYIHNIYIYIFDPYLIHILVFSFTMVHYASLLEIQIPKVDLWPRSPRSPR